MITTPTSAQLYNMVSSLNRQLARLRFVRGQRRSTGRGIDAHIETDLLQLEKARNLLIALEHAARDQEAEPPPSPQLSAFTPHPSKEEPAA